MAAPTVQTVEAEGVTNAEAIIRGYVWDHGSGASVYYAVFRWRKVGAGWTWGNYLLITEDNIYIIIKLTGLDANSDYEFELTGTNNLGEWSYGGVKTFKTRAVAPDGTAGHYWVEGDYWCYLDSGGYKRIIRGEG